MKFTLSWLKEHLETDASLDEIVATMTKVGLEVEEVHDPAALYAPFKVAYVKSAEQHPDADKLQVCIVDTGEEELEVVCGAPNAKAGMKGIFAPVGTQPPNVDFMLEKRKIRGVASNGMLCSEAELGLSDEHDGIIELTEDYPLGTPMAEVFGLDNPVIDFEVTPNRPDWNGVDGIARDLAAAGIGTLKTKMPGHVEGDFDSPMGIELKFEGDNIDACSRFAGRLIKGVKNGPSPAWLQRQLKAIGLRPINALVDMTNYISVDRARPLHVYDYDKLKGTIHARMGKKGEKYLALDGKEYEADKTICVIADDSGVLGFGGIMGGEDTGCTEETTNVFIECAYFDPLTIAQTGRKTGIISDARYRFERGVDPDFVLPGLDFATEMVLDLCGGEPSRVVDAGARVAETGAISFDPAQVKRLTGMDVPEARMVEILTALGFGADTASTPWTVTVPGWRPDASLSADLVEEIARTYGFEHLPLDPLPVVNVVAKPILTPLQERVRRAKRLAAARGLREAVTYSFTHEPWAKLFGGGDDHMRLANPISSDLAQMRPSILPNLLAAMARNVARGFEDVALFEVGPIYPDDGPEDQRTSVTGITRGGFARHWAGKVTAPDAFTAKADALAILEECGAPSANLQVTADAPSWYHPGRSGTLRLGPKNALATFGELHPRVLKELDLKGPVVGFEIILESIPGQRKKTSKAKGTMDASDLMAVTRDFAFVVDTNVSANQMIRAARGADKKLIDSVGVFDVFEGTSIGEGKKSIALMVTLQPKQETLTDELLDAVSQKIIAAVTKATGGQLRG